MNDEKKFSDLPWEKVLLYLHDDYDFGCDWRIGVDGGIYASDYRKYV